MYQFNYSNHPVKQEVRNYLYRQTQYKLGKALTLPALKFELELKLASDSCMGRVNSYTKVLTLLGYKIDRVFEYKGG